MRLNIFSHKFSKVYESYCLKFYATIISRIKRLKELADEVEKTDAPVALFRRKQTSVASICANKIKI